MKSNQTSTKSYILDEHFLESHYQSSMHADSFKLR